MASAKSGKRELILNTAFQLFCEKGYTDTKIIEIADAAGIGKGTVYEYFGSKEDLFYELFNTRIADHYYTQLPVALAVQAGAREKLRELIRFEMDSLAVFGNGKNQLNKFTADMDLFQDVRLQETVCRFIEFRNRTFRDIIREGIEEEVFIDMDPELVSVIVSGAINTFLTHNLNLIPAKEETHPTPWTVDDLLKVIMGGLERHHG